MGSSTSDFIDSDGGGKHPADCEWLSAPNRRARNDVEGAARYDAAAPVGQGSGFLQET